MTAQPVRLAIIDDFDVIVHGVASILAPFDDRVHLVELDTDGVLHVPADVALIDTFGQPEAHDGIVGDVARHPKVGRVAVYTWNFAPRLVEDAFAEGASGYLSKGLDGESLTDALVAVASGEQVVADVGSTGRAEVGRVWPGRDLGLTEREAEVLAHICQGLSTREIAGALFLGINSIKTHTQHLYRKIDVHSRTEAALWGIDHGFRANRDSRANWGG